MLYSTHKTAWCLPIIYFMLIVLCPCSSTWVNLLVWGVLMVTGDNHIRVDLSCCTKTPENKKNFYQNISEENAIWAVSDVFRFFFFFAALSILAGQWGLLFIQNCSLWHRGVQWSQYLYLYLFAPLPLTLTEKNAAKTDPAKMLVEYHNALSQSDSRTSTN